VIEITLWDNICYYTAQTLIAIMLLIIIYIVSVDYYNVRKCKGVWLSGDPYIIKEGKCFVFPASEFQKYTVFKRRQK